MTTPPNEVRLAWLAVPQPLGVSAALSGLLAGALGTLDVKAYVRHDVGDLPLIAVEAPVGDVVAALEDATARLARSAR